jgi:RimJ/RimL family protein N-acetyltransferase
MPEYSRFSRCETALSKALGLATLVSVKPVLETPRVTLREMTLTDLDFVAEMLAHPEVMSFWPKCFDRDEAVNWIERQQARYAKDGVG